MEFLAWFIIVVAGLQFLVSLVNLFSFHFLPRGLNRSSADLSILIPVRNEVKNIANILSDLGKIQDTIKEILVYNDESTDRTEQVIKDYQKRDPRIQLIQGGALPEGWTGKNHACYQLALKAKAAYLLFIDADIRISEGYIIDALNHLINHNLSLISVFPVQDMKSVGEKITVPIMNWILLSMLPMPLIRKSKRPSLAAANGQFMLYPATTYRKYGLHDRFKANPVEDVASIRYLKSQGHMVNTFLGDHSIRCRMYDNLALSIEGFTKNIFLFFGNSIMLTTLHALLITVAPLLIVFYLPVWAWLVYLILVVGMCINISIASKQSVVQNVVLLVPRLFVFWTIILKAIFNYSHGTLLWKGRNILKS